jgi:hypothetical protein
MKTKRSTECAVLMGLGACHGCASGINLAFHVDFRSQIHRIRIFCKGQVHHVEIASLQNWVNTDQTRFVTLRGNRIFLRNTPKSRGGVGVTIESVWERLN